MSELLLDTQLTAEQTEYLTMLKYSTDTLLALVNDILDFSKIESQEIALDVIEFKLPESLGDTLKALAFRATQKGLELACSIPPEMPEYLLGDPGRLRQIILNLVGNAIKFTEKGEVVVQVEIDSQGEDHVMLHFAIRDTGIGIRAEKQEMIFGAFEQADGSATRRYGGTGLGLAITAQLVSLMGGRIWVESAPSKGSTFHFTGRFGLGRNVGTARWAEFARLRNLPALVVDDNFTNRQILLEVLERWKMIPTSADGGTQALELLEQSKRDHNPYALILLDCHMPGVDGFAVAESVQRDPELAGVVILMLTSGGQPGDAARCRQLGIAGYLTKPVKQSELLEAILLALGTPSGDSLLPLVTRHSLREHSRGLCILVAGDNRASQALIVHLLEKRGHMVIVAESGSDVLKVLERPSAIDLLLIDVLVPGVSATECVARIRANEEETGASPIPIIALTSRAMQEDCEKLLGLGFSGCVSEPIRAQDLLAAVDEIAIAPTGAATCRCLGDCAESEHDTLEVLARFEGDKLLVGNLISAFFHDCPKLIAAARHAAARGDSEEFLRVTHVLRNNLALFSAQADSRAAGPAEREGHAPSLEHAGETLARLEEELERLRPALANLGREVAR